MFRAHRNTPRPNCQNLFAIAPLGLDAKIPRLDPLFIGELHAEVVNETATHVGEMACAVKNPNPFFAHGQLLAQHAKRDEVAFGDDGRALLTAQRRRG